MKQWILIPKGIGKIMVEEVTFVLTRGASILRKEWRQPNTEARQRMAFLEGANNLSY